MTEGTKTMTPIFLLETDCFPQPIPLVVIPYVRTAAGANLLPTTLATLRQLHEHLKTEMENHTLLITVKRDPSPRAIRQALKIGTEQGLRVLVFACDCGERCETLLNLIISVFGTQSLTRYQALEGE